MSQIAIKEIERAIKYRERELSSFKNKLELLEEQKKQYEDDLIPKYENEIKELEEVLMDLKIKEDPELKDLPF